MADDPIFSKSSHIALSKLTAAYTFREVERDTTVLLSYQVSEAFCCTKKAFSDMKN